MAHIIMCDGKCKGIIVSGRIISIQEYDGDGLTSEKHYCKTDFLALPVSKLLPPAKDDLSFSISWTNIDDLE